MWADKAKNVLSSFLPTEVLPRVRTHDYLSKPELETMGSFLHNYSVCSPVLTLT